MSFPKKSSENLPTARMISLLQSIDQSINAINQSVSESINQSMQSINQSMQSINAINQSVNQSIDESIMVDHSNRLCLSSVLHLFKTIEILDWNVLDGIIRHKPRTDHVGRKSDTGGVERARRLTDGTVGRQLCHFILTISEGGVGHSTGEIAQHGNGGDVPEAGPHAQGRVQAEETLIRAVVGGQTAENRPRLKRTHTITHYSHDIVLSSFSYTMVSSTLYLQNSEFFENWFLH